MNYIIILFMIMMSIVFAILSSYVKKSREIFIIGSAICFLITGILILGNGIEVPIGTVTEIIR